MSDLPREPRRLAALRGLRALSLHAGGDQERDSDAVRDRLSARLRASAARRPSTTSGSNACSPPPTARGLRATVRFLHAAGERHAAVERRIELEPTNVHELAGRSRNRRGVRVRGRAAVDAADARLRAELLDVLDGEGRQLVRIRCCVHNTTALDAGRGACATSGPTRCSRACSRPTWCSRPTAGRFVSPLEREGIAGAAVAACENVNTWPVLATADDTRRAGGADHPPRAPERGPGEPRQPLRQHRDRGGAAAARPGRSPTPSARRSAPRTRRCGR